MASPIPQSLPFKQAVVLPLAVSTASAALFQTEDGLGLPAPSVEILIDSTADKSTLEIKKMHCSLGDTSAVGGNAIKLAVAASVEVIVTASRKYTIFPEPKVAGNGLHMIQGAFAESKKVSASKTVVVVA
jgi:NADPH:quinone reductase-like Zn-dependent oxidoreductase